MIDNGVNKMAEINPDNAIKNDKLDMRGENVNPTNFYEIGRNIVVRLKGKGIEIPQIAVGGDSRQDTPELLDALEEGIIKEGGAVFSIGYDIPKPLAYFAAEMFRTDSVAYVTASHLNAESNGIKVNTLNYAHLIPLTSKTKVNVRESVLEFYRIYLKSCFDS